MLGNARMSAEECVLALEDAIEEIKNVCPEVSNTFIFGKNKKILAKDESTDEATVSQIINAFSAMDERAASSGGVDSAAFYGANKQTVIVRVNNLFLAMVASKEADEKTLNVITRVLFPTMLKLVGTAQPEFAGAETPPTAVEDGAGEVVADAENHEEPFSNNLESDAVPESPLPNPVVSQLMVENLTGFGVVLGPADSVRIDSKLIQRWKQLYGETKIEEVQVEETCTGKKLRCKFNPIRDSKFSGKGVIQMPQKVQLILQTKKGALVMVKPIIERTEGQN